MPPVPPLPFSEAIYNHLPAKERKKLARATGKQSAFSSASLLSNTLKNPAVVKALPKDSFGSYINNKSGQIKWWTRLKLTLRHFYHALFSNYAKLSKDFAKLVERLCKGNASKANSKGDSATRKEATSSGPVGNRGTLARDFALNMGASAAGNVIGHKLTDAHNERNAQKSGGDGGDSAVDKTSDPEDAEKLRSEGPEDQDEDVRSDSGDDVSEADDDDQSDVGSDPDHDDGPDNDGADSERGGWFSWLGGGDGDGDGGGGD